MKSKDIILRTKNTGDIVIDRSYTLIYEAIDKLISAKRKVFTDIDDNKAEQLFNDLEFHTFGEWPSYAAGPSGAPIYDRLSVIEVID